MKTWIILTALLALSACCMSTPTSGDKIGQVAKVQYAGILCKTTEILVTGKFGGGELHLTVPKALVSQVLEANDTQAFVKVRYHTNFINWTCKNDTDNQWLDAIELHPEGAPR